MKGNTRSDEKLHMASSIGKFVKLVEVTDKTAVSHAPTKPPTTEAPLQIDMSAAKRVASIPGGHIRAASTRTGIKEICKKRSGKQTLVCGRGANPLGSRAQQLGSANRLGRQFACFKSPNVVLRNLRVTCCALQMKSHTVYTHSATPWTTCTVHNQAAITYSVHSAMGLESLDLGGT